jgi:hypothetical protein
MQPVERLLAGTSVVLLLLAAAGGGRALDVVPHLAAGLVVLLLAARWLDPASHPLTYWVRELLPFPLLLNIFQSLGTVIAALRPETFDRLLIVSDHHILGRRLFTALWSAHLPWPITDLLSIAYCSFYFLPFALYIWMAARRHPDRQWVITALLATFLVSYAGYFLLPAFGPRATIAAGYYRTLPAGLVGGHLRGLLDVLERTKVDAFPSGHVMVTLLTLFFVQRYRPAWLWLYLPCSALLIAATVLLAYHYVTDVLVGILVMPAGPVLARVLFPAFGSVGAHAAPPVPGLDPGAGSRTAPPRPE